MDETGASDTFMTSTDCSMLQLVGQLQDAALQAYEEEYKKDHGITTKEQLVFPPATPEQVATFEATHAITLPDDFKEFLAVTNGFRGVENWCDAGVCSIGLPTDKTAIDILRRSAHPCDADTMDLIRQTCANERPSERTGDIDDESDQAAGQDPSKDEMAICIGPREWEYGAYSGIFLVNLQEMAHWTDVKTEDEGWCVVVVEAVPDEFLWFYGSFRAWLRAQLKHARNKGYVPSITRINDLPIRHGA